MKYCLTAGVLLLLLTSACTTQRSLTSKRNCQSETNSQHSINQVDYIAFEGDTFIGRDSLIFQTYPNGQIQSVARYALNKYGRLTFLINGVCKTFNLEGKLVQKGFYKIGKYPDCADTDGSQQFYHYKVGQWNNFYQNGKRLSQIYYDVKQVPLNSNCDELTSLPFGTVNTERSKLWDDSGEQVDIAPEFRCLYEKVFYVQGRKKIEELYVEDGNLVHDVVPN